MKKLRNILASMLCVSVLFGCQYTGDLYGKYTKKPTPPQTQNIPSAPSNQTEQQPSQQIPPPEVTQAPATPIKIALLVPLSGQHKNLGKGLVDAAQLAVFRIGDARITITPIDTGDSTAGAVDAANKAISEGAKIILGPVFSNSAKAIAKVSAENNIPVVSFSNDKSLAGTGVFAIGFLPEQQISRIVNFSASHGIKEFISMLPGDTYGNTIAKELTKIKQENPGISFLKNITYQTDSQGRAISLDTHLQSAVDTAKNKTTEAPVGLLVPANAAVTNTVLTFFNQNMVDKSKIQLLGSDQWNSTQLLSNPALDGAMFTASPTERRLDFENKFRNTYGHEAPKLASLAYDGVALTATIARLSQDGNFTKESLANSRGFIGVDGIFRLHSDGLTERGFTVMSVKNGRAIVIDPAPKSFSEVR